MRVEPVEPTRNYSPAVMLELLLIEEKHKDELYRHVRNWIAAKTDDEDMHQRGILTRFADSLLSVGIGDEGVFYTYYYWRQQIALRLQDEMA